MIVNSTETAASWPGLVATRITIYIAQMARGEQCSVRVWFACHILEAVIGSSTGCQKT